MEHAVTKILRTPEELHAAALQVDKLLTNACKCIRAAIHGSYAMHYYGQPRPLGDLDILSSPRFIDRPFAADNGVMVDVESPETFFPDAHPAALVEEAIRQAPRYGYYLKIVGVPHLLAIKYVGGTTSPSSRNPRPEPSLADFHWLAEHRPGDLHAAREILKRFLRPDSLALFEMTCERMRSCAAEPHPHGTLLTSPRPSRPAP